MRPRPLLAAPLNIGRSSSVSPRALIGGGRLELPASQAGWKPQRINSNDGVPSWLPMTGTDCDGETLKRGWMLVSESAPRPNRPATSSVLVSVYRPHMDASLALT